MLEVLDLFRGQEALSVGRQDPYVRSHPLTRDRYRTVQAFLATQGAGPEPSVASAYWYARLNAKLSAFLRNPSWTLRRIDRNDTGEIATLSAPSPITARPMPTARWPRSGGSCRCARTIRSTRSFRARSSMKAAASTPPSPPMAARWSLPRARR
jgi:hypothetical protein